MEKLILSILIMLAVFLLGFIAGRLSKRFKKIGRFVINEGDPTKSAFWLELDYDLDVIERQDTIGLKVHFHNSQPPME